MMTFTWLNEVSGSYGYMLENLTWLKEVTGVYIGI